MPEPTLFEYRVNYLYHNIDNRKENNLLPRMDVRIENLKEATVLRELDAAHCSCLVPIKTCNKK